MKVDVLHAVDQGISSHIIGNVMWYVAVIRGHLGGRIYAERIKALDSRVKDWYKKTKCPYKIQGPVTLERVRTSKQWPKFKSKAAATRKLAQFAFELICEFSDPTDEHWGRHDILAQGVCQLLCRFYELLASNSMFLSPEGRVEIQEVGNMLASMYAQLSNIAWAMDVKLWKMNPKLHCFIHLCVDQAPYDGNPRFYWTYSDEDLIGQLIDIAEGVHPSTLAFAVLYKWLVCVFDDLLVSTDP